jgi:hypothetical protein
MPRAGTTPVAADNLPVGDCVVRIAHGPIHQQLGTDAGIWISRRSVHAWYPAGRTGRISMRRTHSKGPSHEVPYAYLWHGGRSSVDRDHQPGPLSGPGCPSRGGHARHGRDDEEVDGGGIAVGASQTARAVRRILESDHEDVLGRPGWSSDRDQGDFRAQVDSGRTFSARRGPGRDEVARRHRADEDGSI